MVPGFRVLQALSSLEAQGCKEDGGNEQADT